MLITHQVLIGVTYFQLYFIFAFDSKTKKELKDLYKKVEVLTKTNKELKTSFNNQATISNLYLEDCKALQNEVQHYIKEAKALKDLKDKDQANEANYKDIVIINQNDDISYKNNYEDLMTQLKDLFECPLSLDCIKTPIILLSGFTIEEEFFDRLVDSKDPYNKEFIVKHKIHNRFVRQVKEIVEASEDQILKQQHSYQEIKAQFEIDKQECSKDTQTDFDFRFEEVISFIKQFNNFIGNYNSDEHRNQQIIEKLQEELIYINKVKERALKLLKVEQTKNKAEGISNFMKNIKEDKSLMCDLS